MALSPRSVLEITIPLIAVYILIGAPAFSIPQRARDALDAIFTSDRDASPAAQPALSQKNLDWALETLLLPTPNLTIACPAPHYTTHIYSVDPLVLYLDDFLTPAEAAELSALAEPLYTPATVFRASGDSAHNHEARDAAVRQSERAALPPTAPLTACIAERARALQGWRPDLFIETLYAQRYTPGGHYAAHYDWGGGGGAAGGRASSMMAWVAAGCAGGGTQFPRLARREGAWCGRVACGAGAGEGTTFVPRAGAAVYWENFARDGGAPFAQSWHAGLPVEEGEKVGLNVWSWWQPGLGAAMEEERRARREA